MRLALILLVALCVVGCSKMDNPFYAEGYNDALAKETATTDSLVAVVRGLVAEQDALRARADDLNREMVAELARMKYQTMPYPKDIR